MELRPLDLRFTRTQINRILTGLDLEPPLQPVFHSWCQGPKALVPPSVRIGKGRKGDSWDLASVILISWIVRLRKEGVSLQALRGSFQFLQAKLPAALKRPEEFALIAGPGRRPIILRRGESIGIDTVRGFHGQFVALDAVLVREVRRAAEEEARRAA